MFRPKVLEETEGQVKIQINDSVVLTINKESFDKDGTLDINFDEKILTAQEAEEQANNFITEVITVFQQKGVTN